MRSHEILDADIICVGNAEYRCWTEAGDKESIFPPSQTHCLCQKFPPPSVTLCVNTS